MAPQQMAHEAAAILAAVMNTDWPESDEAQWAIGRDYAGGMEALGDYALLLGGELDPLAIGAEDAGWWDDPQSGAAEWAADRALQYAREARKRLGEYQRRAAEDAARLDGGVLLAATRMTTMTGGGL